MFASKVAQEKDYPPVIDDYPESIIELLKIFHKVWLLPEGAVPSKKQDAKYKEWVLQLTQLSLLLANSQQAQEAMQLAYNKYEKLSSKFIIARPIAIKSLLVDAVGEINRRNRKVKNGEQASQESVKKAIRNLESELEEKEEEQS